MNKRTENILGIMCGIFMFMAFLLPSFGLIIYYIENGIEQTSTSGLYTFMAVGGLVVFVQALLIYER